jgi:biogenesis of lysosome-related organelles complex 1 subunit 2
MSEPPEAPPTTKEAPTTPPTDETQPTPPPTVEEAAAALADGLGSFIQHQTEELADTFDLVFTTNQAAVDRYSGILEEAINLKEKSKLLEEQEIGIASFLSNLMVISDDLTRLENAIGKLEKYTSLLERKVAKPQ